MRFSRRLPRQHSCARVDMVVAGVVAVCWTAFGLEVLHSIMAAGVVTRNMCPFWFGAAPKPQQQPHSVRSALQVCTLVPCRLCWHVLGNSNTRHTQATRARPLQGNVATFPCPGWAWRRGCDPILLTPPWCRWRCTCLHHRNPATQCSHTRRPCTHHSRHSLTIKL